MLAARFLVGLPLWFACAGTASPVKAPPPGPGDTESENLLDFDPKDLVHFKLVADVEALPIGGEAQLGALFEIQEDWHIYWINPGESGLPTRFTIKETPGLAIEAPRFPGPTRFDSDGEIVNYGYHHSLLVPMRITAIEAGETAEFTAEARWLACRDDACVPGQGSDTLRLERAAGPAQPSQTSARFQQAVQELPRPFGELSELGVHAELHPDGARSLVTLRAPVGTRLEIFPIHDKALADLQSTDTTMQFVLQRVDANIALAVLSVQGDSDTHFFAITSELLAGSPPPKGTP